MMQSSITASDTSANVAESEFGDLFSSHYGRPRRRSWRSRRFGKVSDVVFDVRLAINPSYRSLRRRAATMPRQKILVTSVDVPKRRAELDVVLAQFLKSRHDVTAKTVPMGERGKFQNINLGLADTQIDEFDWLIFVDDDVDLPPDFLDVFLCVAELADLRICQPAHRFRSYTSWEVTQRVWNSLARVTRFVECGPITAFHRSVMPSCMPFSDTRWAWGIDVLWSELALQQGFKMGIIDATPIGHLRPISGSYEAETAIKEYRELMARYSVRRDSRDLLKTLRTISEF
jgi:hypothetical protein